eukprot:jgi/Mesvir1/29625/Mv21477-RA.1
MVAFGKTLKDEHVPEWREAYVNYEALKACVDLISEASQGERRSAPSLTAHDEETGGKWRLVEPSGSASVAPRVHVYEAFGRHWSTVASSWPWQRHRRSSNPVCPAIMVVRESYWRENGGREERLRTRWRTRQHASPTHRDVSASSVRPTPSRRPEEQAQEQEQEQEQFQEQREGPAGASPPGSPLPLGAPAALFGNNVAWADAEAAFFRRLDAELNKVDCFYQRKKRECTERFHQMEEQLQTLQRLRQVQGGSQAYALSFPSGLIDALRRGRGVRKLARAQAMLELAIGELHYALMCLNSYGYLNALAIAKILKKHDKVAGWCALEPYLDAVRQAEFASSTEVTVLVQRVEDEFSAYLSQEPGQLTRSLRVVRPSTSHCMSFTLGALMGVLCCLLAYLALLLDNGPPQPEPRERFLQSVFPVYRGLLLIILHFLVYGLDLLVFARARINYPFIFGFRRGTELTGPQFLLSATAAGALVLTALIGHLTLQQLGPSSPWGWLGPLHPYLDLTPGVLLLLFLGIFLCPFNVCWRPSRAFFLRTMGRIACAPFFTVRSFHDLHYGFCYYAGGSFRTEAWAPCRDSATFTAHNLYVGLLPFVWRLLQCLRRYGHGRSHPVERLQLVNAGKYAAACGVLVARHIHKHVDPVTCWWSLPLFVATACVASVYSFLWDITMDWDLMRWQRHHVDAAVASMSDRTPANGSSRFSKGKGNEASTRTNGSSHIACNSLVDRSSHVASSTAGVLRTNNGAGGGAAGDSSNGRVSRLSSPGSWLCWHSWRTWLVRERELFLSVRGKYIGALVVNAALRLTWVFSIIPSPFGASLPGELLDLLLSALEVVRRGIWNILRVENEHLNNVGQFRETQAMPLPFT